MKSNKKDFFNNLIKKELRGGRKMFFQSFLESALPAFTKVRRGLGQSPIYNQKYFFLKEKKPKSFCRNPFSFKKRERGILLKSFFFLKRDMYKSL